MNWTMKMVSVAKGALLQLGLIACIFLLSASISLGGTFVAFGPENYIRATGKPTPVTSTFSVLNPNTTYTLRIDNGGLNGEFARVSSAVVTVNGVEVAKTNDFNQNVAVIEKPVTLASNNELVVEVRSKPGSGFALQIIGVDNDPPTITATANPPPNAADWNNINVTVSFDCADSTSGIASCPEPVVVETEGADQVIEGTAEDNAGNTATASVTVHLDKTPPSFSPTINPSPNGNGWNNTNVTVSFEATDGLSGITSVTDPVPLAQEGAAQVVNGTATDVAGNSTTASATVNLDTTPPSLSPTIDPPPNGNGWNNTDVTVSFEATDSLSGIASVTEPITLTTDGAGQEFSGTTADRAGNTTTTSATVNLDKTAPIIQVSSPDDGTTLSTSPVTVTGTITDDLSGIASATCNGIPVSLSGAAFTCDVSLTEGANLIEIQATDIAGNTSSSSITVTFAPSIPPVVNITAPANLSLFNTSPIVVSGTIDERAVSVAVNGIPATLGNGTWTGTAPLKEGNNTVTAVAQDANGNAGTASVQVTLDTTPPRVTIDAPADGFVTNNSSITVAGMINDIVVGTVNGDQAQVTVNGIPAQVANRSFLVADVPLAPGANTITATGTDKAGNTATASITITFEELLAQPHIQPVSGNNQSSPIGARLPDPLVVALKDANGDPVAEKTVIFKVMRNNSLLSDSSTGVRSLAITTDVQGQAQALWTLGTRAGAGNNMVEATAVGFAGKATFTAIALPSAAAKINVDAGNKQIGVVGQLLPHPFVAVVTDAGHNRLANVPVTFTVLEGGGSLNGQLSVTVNTDSDGRALATLTLGPEEGNDNNFVSADFPANPSFPASFRASARVVGNADETRVSGVVLDNSDVPISGVTLSIPGTSLVTQSDDQGQFVLQPAPVRAIFLEVDGSTANRPGVWPHLEFELVTIAGIDNRLERPIYLLPIDEPRGLFVDENTGGVLTLLDLPGFSLTIEKGSVIFPGSGKSGVVSVTLVHADKVPMTPGFGQQPRFIITIQPAGAIFDPPAPVTFPNVDGLAPGEVTELYSFDHDLGQFVAIGTGTVSEDGSVLVSDPGVGILKAGWHCGGNPVTGVCIHNCPECQFCQEPPCVCLPDVNAVPTSLPDIPQDCKEPGCVGGTAIQVPDDTESPPQASTVDCKKQICSGGAVMDVPNDTEIPTTLCKECQGGNQVNRQVCTQCSTGNNVCDVSGTCVPIQNICPQLDTTWNLGLQSPGCPNNIPSPRCGITATFSLVSATNSCGIIPNGAPIAETVVLNGCGYNNFNVLTTGTCTVGNCDDEYSVCFSNSLIPPNIPPLSGVPRIPQGICTVTATQILDFGSCTEVKTRQFEFTGNGSDCVGQVTFFD